jgi:hypothetical protein
VVCLALHEARLVRVRKQAVSKEASSKCAVSK